MLKLDSRGVGTIPPRQAPGGRDSEPAAGTADALPSGTLLNGYRLISVIGQGSFGIVYLAECEVLGREVAIKEYFPRSLALRAQDGAVVASTSEREPQFLWGRGKLLQEAALLKRLSTPNPHPNIVAVRNCFEANGTAYLVMDYERGEPLSKLLEQQAIIDPVRLPSIVEPLLDALEHLHQAGAVHQDIKPANILIRPNGLPVLLDLGSARIEDAAATESDFNTLSPAYAPIERHGSGHAVGPWTDIYSLGVTLYRAITGKLPPSATRRLVRDEMIAPRRAAKGRYAKGTLKAIEQALQVRPENRPQSIAAWRKLVAVRPRRRFCPTPEVLALAESFASLATRRRASRPAYSMDARTRSPRLGLSGVILMRAAATMLFVVLCIGETSPGEAWQTKPLLERLNLASQSAEESAAFAACPWVRFGTEQAELFCGSTG